MESIKKFPRGISDQVISSRNAATVAGRRAPGPGLKRQASSNKHRSGSESVRILVNHWRWLETQGSSYKLQAASCKLQAISQVKRQATSVVCGPNHQAPSKAFRDGR